jgi:hypothetical protein
MRCSAYEYTLPRQQAAPVHRISIFPLQAVTSDGNSRGVFNVFELRGAKLYGLKYIQELLAMIGIILKDSIGK